MRFLALGALWYALVAVGGAVAWGTLRRQGIGEGSGWAVARLVGWCLAGYAAWLAGWAGLAQWWWVGVAVLVALAAMGWRSWRGVRPAMLADAELVGLGTFLLLAWLRLPSLAVTGTEKPMDLAILSTLLRPGTFPPHDPWLAGHTLPYYYWGFVPWVLPARVLGLAPDVAYNLLVPTLAAVAAQAAWALARGLGGSRRSALMAAFLVVFAGTPDGWRQLLAGTHLNALDLWGSSRAIAGAITEFPLFTFWLGDLHPHLLATPLLLVSLFLARSASTAPGRRRLTWLLAALAYGAAAAANPWVALPLGIAVLLMITAREERMLWPTSAEGVGAWLRAGLLGLLGWVLFIPFWLHFHPPAAGFGLVHGGTRWDELVLFLGAVLVPPALVAWQLAGRWGGFNAARRQLVRVSWLTGMVVVAVVARRPVLALALGLAYALLVGVVGGRQRRARPSWALACVALLLVAIVELVYVRDPYGGELYRMNTVFKETHLAFTLLAVVAPVLLGWLRRRRPGVAIAAAVLVLLAGLPQLANLALQTGRLPAGWGGLGWMNAGDREAAEFLRQAPAGASLVELVGDAYSDAARISVASGVPAVLGWENHERVWRGDSISAELVRRKELVQRLYECGDAAEVRRLAAQLGARYVVLGSLEEKKYSPGALDAIARAGRVVFAQDGCRIVDLHG
jgi:YYY domain-containing protein